jgi:hypothetical protein
MLRPVIAGRGAFFAPRRAERLAGPGPEQVDLLEHIRRHLVVLHGARPLPEGPERAHPALLVIGAVRVIHLEVQGVVVDEPEEDAVRVEPHASEHAARGDGRNSPELIDDIVAVRVADGHESEPIRSFPAAPGCARQGARRVPELARLPWWTSGVAGIDSPAAER